jgi:hypothetical protein
LIAANGAGPNGSYYLRREKRTSGFAHEIVHEIPGAARR